jgi:tripartite ATP-independent transporter DctP family solute receptor
MKRFSKGIAILIACAFGLSVFSSVAFSADVVIKAASASAPDSFHGVCLYKFKELAEKYSNGKIQVNVLLGGSLGSEQDNVQQCSTGMLHVSTMAVNNVTPFSSAVGFMTLPYIFPKLEDAYKLFRSDYVKKDLQELMIKQANVRALAWLVGGYRVLTNSKREVLRPADLKGLTIRVPKNDIMIASYKAWGINPVPMAWTETFNALQQGVVDGQDNPHIVNATSKFFEVQKYITDIHYILWTGPILASEIWYTKLSPDIRGIVDRAAQEAAEYEWKYVEQKEGDALKECLSKGMKISEPADHEKEWIEKARAIWPQFYDSVGGKSIVDKVQAAMAK